MYISKWTDFIKEEFLSFLLHWYQKIVCLFKVVVRGVFCTQWQLIIQTNQLLRIKRIWQSFSEYYQNSIHVPRVLAILEKSKYSRHYFIILLYYFILVWFYHVFCVIWEVIKWFFTLSISLTVFKNTHLHMYEYIMIIHNT